MAFFLDCKKNTKNEWKERKSIVTDINEEKSSLKFVHHIRRIGENSNEDKHFQKIKRRKKTSTLSINMSNDHTHFHMRFSNKISFFPSFSLLTIFPHNHLFSFANAHDTLFPSRTIFKPSKEILIFSSFLFNFGSMEWMRVREYLLPSVEVEILKMKKKNIIINGEVKTL